MATAELSDDDNSFSASDSSKPGFDNIDFISEVFSSDEDYYCSKSKRRPKGGENKSPQYCIMISDDEEDPAVAQAVIKQRNAAIKSLFPSKIKNDNVRIIDKPEETWKKSGTVAKTSDADMKKDSPLTNMNPTIETPKTVCNKMIEGINVMLPVNPYGSQLALMSRILAAMKKGENCILESPTGSGKTLALLCGALAWQQHEQNRIGQSQAQQYFTQYPELQKEGVAEYISQPIDQKTDVTPEKLFSKNNFGEMSIYQNGEGSTSKRPEKTPYKENSCEESKDLVTIHKRPRLDSVELKDGYKTPPAVTPEKRTQPGTPNTPEDVRLPIIYYGARTHNQLKQVIKEFKRTSYCGMVKMTLLSSRDNSCIKEFHKDLWSSKKDMCRACIKPFSQTDKNAVKTQCQYYDNRAALNHRSLPPAFDLEDLVKVGKEIDACPYYGARLMAQSAHIVFCPYNYLIDPIIRKNMSISLENNIIIIDEAHNIESKCREAADVHITRIQIQNSLKELEKVAEYRYANRADESIDELIKTLKNWDYWFENQTSLVKNRPVNNNEAVYRWKAQHFLESLNNHNIGSKDYNGFRCNAENLCRRLRDDPRTLLGVTEATSSLLETMYVTLGYLFRCDCKFIDDFEAVLIRRVTGKTDSPSNKAWRASQFNKWIAQETITLSLICLNPAIVMKDLHAARCIALASGTLTPLGNLHAELGTSFPHCVSPNHVIPADRVWIGTLIGDANGQQRYIYDQIKQPSVQKALGLNIVRVCEVTPHGVLCFVPSYSFLDSMINEWQRIGLWYKMKNLKNVFCENRNLKDHDEVMEDFYQCVGTKKGALLFAVYRGKVSEGMDFKDHQARSVICVGVPYPSKFETPVKAKMEYNDKYSKERDMLSGDAWYEVQAFRALNQAVGRCVRHRGDWGAVLLVDARYAEARYKTRLSKWVRAFLGENHHTYESLLDERNGLAAFMQRMTILDEQENSN